MTKKMSLDIHQQSLSAARHGIVPRRSRLTNLLVMEEKVTTIMDSGEIIDLIFLDFAKAFDSVIHRLLLHKLATYGLHSSLLAWIKSFLEDRTFFVSVNGSISSPKAAVGGVRQGSGLGPIFIPAAY